MNNRWAGIARVPLNECKRRAVEFGKGQREPLPASSFAAAIWPGHKMTGQGAGAAASRALKNLEKEGRAGWRSIGDGPFKRWGWWAR